MSMTELSQFLNRDRLAPVQSVFVLVLVTTVLTSCTWSLDEATQIHAPRLLFGASWHVKICSSPSSRCRFVRRPSAEFSLTGRPRWRGGPWRASTPPTWARGTPPGCGGTRPCEKNCHMLLIKIIHFSIKSCRQVELHHKDLCIENKDSCSCNTLLLPFVMSQKALGKVACFRVRPHSET